MSYIGNEPAPESIKFNQEATATAGTNTITTNGYAVGFVDVYIDGLRKSSTEFTASNGTDVVIANMTGGEKIIVEGFSDFKPVQAALVGMNQAWTDYTYSGAGATVGKSKNTEYQNTTGLPIMVSVSFTTSDANTGTFRCYSNSVGNGDGLVGGMIVAEADGGDYYSSGASTVHYANITVIVPDTYYYRLTEQAASGTPLIIRRWSELR